LKPNTDAVNLQLTL